MRARGLNAVIITNGEHECCSAMDCHLHSLCTIGSLRLFIWSEHQVTPRYSAASWLHAELHPALRTSWSVGRRSQPGGLRSQRPASSTRHASSPAASHTRFCCAVTYQCRDAKTAM